MKKFYVFAKQESSDWWDSLTEEQQKKHIEDHPASKYAVDTNQKKEDSVNNLTSPSEGDDIKPSAGGSEPADAALDDLLIDVDEDDEEIAKKAVSKTLSEMNFGEIVDALNKPVDSEEGMTNVHALAFGLCFLVALTLVVALPEESADSIKILASHAANNYYENITRDKKDKVEEKDNISAKVSTTSEERHSAEERLANNRQLGYDENGNLVSDNAADDLTKLFLRTNQSTIV